jgi:hypothetical protein
MWASQILSLATDCNTYNMFKNLCTQNGVSDDLQHNESSALRAPHIISPGRGWISKQKLKYKLQV